MRGGEIISRTDRSKGQKAGDRQTIQRYSDFYRSDCKVFTQIASISLLSEAAVILLTAGQVKIKWDCLPTKRTGDLETLPQMEFGPIYSGVGTHM